MSQRLPAAPAFVSHMMRPLPLWPLSQALTRIARAMLARHPAIVRRMGMHSGRHFVFTLTDLPFQLLLVPADATITAFRGARAHDAMISGPLSAFLAMLHGAADGDALFFSRELTISGDTAAVLALRNALDDAELDLAEEIRRLGGPFAAPLGSAIMLAERLTGLPLHRMEPQP